jgi:hypothetical protein
MTDIAAVQQSRTIKRLRNSGVITSEVLLACAALTLFVLRAPAIIGWISGLGALVLLWTVYSEVRGIAVSDTTIWCPRRPLSLFPVFCFGRQEVALSTLQEMTYASRSMGMQIVLLEGGAEPITLAFGSRRARLAFFEVVRTVKPTIKLYRYGL